ncbi:DUF1858 domain-containing protein [Azospirillum thermophilum]|uniref:DUF1858 domain-containing protein n=1 Tax=Azospirillum thermophilum TaxID=2202148 RepID=A0A2S2CUK8_9PROT|nr:DUF1858 domain-containing protein [Azospirillum thermophilum]AWK88204.1 hypothetical protein DEW08_19005 [Azospirillum thermophilum]
MAADPSPPRPDAVPSADEAAARMTVGELLRQRPALVAVFVRRRMACPGCAMAPFMTLGEVADAYGLPVGALLSDLGLAGATHSPAHSPESLRGIKEPAGPAPHHAHCPPRRREVEGSNGNAGIPEPLDP